MLHTSRNLLCWLRSTKTQTCYQKPFALVSLKASKAKYCRYFQRYIAFAFRRERAREKRMDGETTVGRKAMAKAKAKKMRKARKDDEDEKEEEVWNEEVDDSSGAWEE